MESLLPLFPLQVVLAPGAPLPLHIFEPRYKEMIGECLEQKTPFGVVLARENNLAEIGCTAEILEVLKKYADGRIDIRTAGRRRFEVVALNGERSFLRAEVMFFDDDGPGASPDQRIQALRLQSQLLQLFGAQAREGDAAQPQLSFLLVGALPLDLDFKQCLLGMRSEQQRIAAIIEYYETILPSIRRAVQARQRARGNGHGV